MLVTNGASLEAPIHYVHRKGIWARPIHLAVAAGDGSLTKVLVQTGANPNSLDDQGETPLIWAIARTSDGVTEAERLRIIEILLKSGADPNQSDTSAGWTPLMWAADLSNAAAVRALLSAGANVNYTNGAGMSPLLCTKDPQIAKQLLSAGANPNLRVAGKTAVQRAQEDGRVELLAVLTNHSAATQGQAAKP